MPLAPPLTRCMNLSYILKSYLELTPVGNKCHTACAKSTSRVRLLDSRQLPNETTPEGEIRDTMGVNRPRFVGRNQ